MIADALSPASPLWAREWCNHLWQSTVFVGVVALLALLLRKNHARTRYWLWMSAAVKFLAPFSLLAALGSHLPWPHPAAPAKASTYVAIEAMSQPFSEDEEITEAPHPVAQERRQEGGAQILPAALGGAWMLGFLGMTAYWWVQWRRVSKIVRAAEPVHQGREVEMLRRLERAAGVSRPTPLRSSGSSMEPGVVGMLRPVLLWPEGISQRLDDAHLEREVEMLRRLERAAGVSRPTPLRSSGSSMEPGVVGMLRPVLLWPEGISQRLDDAHLERVLAHEVCHVRRRDNLTSVAPMLVEAIFWFHPLVWWIERQLVKERERACDEEVLLRCGEPGVYAQSILKVCQYCVESPVVCVSGITGADLKRRVAEIMAGGAARRLTWPKKLLLGAVAGCAVGVPVVLGQAKAAQRMMLAAIDSAPRPFRAAARAMIPEVETPSMGEIAEMQSVAGPPAVPLPMYEYEAATIKPSKGPGPDHKIGVWAAPDGFSAWFITPQQMISFAYGVENYQVSGGPGWLSSERFDIEAKMDAATADALAKLSQDQRALAQQQMFQALLTDRFQLMVHHETKELASYTLVTAKGGPKLKQAKPGDTYPNGGTFFDGTHAGAGSIWESRIGDLTAQAVPLARLVQDLTQMLGAPVSDKTELKGVYDFKLRYIPDDRLQPPSGSTAPGFPPRPPDSDIPSLFDALQEQLGLKLVARKGPVDVIVIGHIERPASVDGAEMQGRARVLTVAQVKEKADDAAFDVASIHPSPPSPDGHHHIWNDVHASQFRTGNLSLRDLIQYAYNLPKSQIVGGPAWLDSSMYDIDAKSGPEADAQLKAMSSRDAAQQKRQMVEALLADRFAFAAHPETRELPLYKLVVARGGAKFRLNNEVGNTDNTGRDHLHVTGMTDTVPILARDLAQLLGRVVVDQTGLTGSYDLTLRWTPDDAPPPLLNGAPDPNAPPGLFTAIQEQLGLKLESATGAVKILVVDHVELPTPN